MTTLKPAPILLAKHLRELRFEFQREYKFFAGRKWMADFYIRPDVLIEIEGAIWTQGRHTRGKGFIADMEKYNTAAMLGFKVLRFSTKDVLSGKAKEFLKEWL